MKTHYALLWAFLIPGIMNPMEKARSKKRHHHDDERPLEKKQKNHKSQTRREQLIATHGTLGHALLSECRVYEGEDDAAKARTIKFILEQPGVDINTTDFCGTTAVMRAAEEGLPETLTTILGFGPAIHATDCARNTALIVAAAGKNPQETIPLLFDREANINDLNYIKVPSNLHRINTITAIKNYQKQNKVFVKKVAPLLTPYLSVASTEKKKEADKVASMPLAQLTLDYLELPQDYGNCAIKTITIGMPYGRPPMWGRRPG